MLVRHGRVLVRLIEGISPRRIRRAAKRALLRLMNPRRELAEMLEEYTHVVTLTAQTDEGLVPFDVRDKGVGWPLALQGRWEPKESACFQSLVSQGDLVIDVGANIGWYTLLLSRLVGETGTVLAFEPDPRNFELLSETIRLNAREGRVTAHQLALLSDDGTAEFELSAQNFGDHRVRFRPPESSHEREQYAEQERRVIRVKARTLDGVLTDNATLRERTVIKLIKVDCQGAEPAVVGGALRSLARTAYLAIEYWPYGIRRAGFDPVALLGTISAIFDSFAVLDETSLPIRFQPIAGLGRHATSVTDFADYLFRNTELSRNA